MINDSQKVRSYLLTKTALTALVSSRIYAERNNPPPGYTPGIGGAITFKRRGGAPDYSGALVVPSYQFKCYAATEADANQVYRALYDALQEGKSADIKFAVLETVGETLREPDSQWIYVLCFFTILVANP
jgi:hypothetical protein